MPHSEAQRGTSCASDGETHSMSGRLLTLYSFAQVTWLFQSTKSPCGLSLHAHT